MSVLARENVSRLDGECAADSPIQEKEGAQAFSSVITANASLVVWLVFLGFGGALLIFYYSHIHYFPDLEWNKSLTYLAAMSLMGGAIAILYSLLLFFPGVIWSEFLIHDSGLEDKLCYAEGGHYEPCYQRVGLHIGLPFLVFMGVMHVAALSDNAWTIATAAFLTLVVASLVLGWRFQKHLEQKRSTLGTNPLSLLLKYVGLFNISALISLTSMLLIYDIADSSKESRWMLLLCTVIGAVANMLVAIQYRYKRACSVVTAILAALVLLACGEGVAGRAGQEEAALSLQFMARFGFGGNTVKLVLKPEAREILQAHGVEDTAGTGVATMENVRILSRLGEEYFVELPAPDRKRMTFPSSLVLSWSAQDEDVAK